jgi:hypothetical protein
MRHLMLFNTELVSVMDSGVCDRGCRSSSLGFFSFLCICYSHICRHRVFCFCLSDVILQGNGCTNTLGSREAFPVFRRAKYGMYLME